MASECPNHMSMGSIDVEMDEEETIKSVEVDERIHERDWPKRVRFIDEKDDDDDPQDDSDDENDSVPFTIVGPLLVPSSEMTIEERSEIWWQPHECSAQKATAKNIAAAIRRREPPCDPNGNPTAYCNVVARVFSACMSHRFQRPSPDDIEKLAHWARVAHSRRGLERWSIPQVAKVRKECRAAVLTSVLDLQYESGDRYGSDDLAQQIRIASEQLSKSARRFALCMGQADQLALLEPVPVPAPAAPQRSPSPNLPGKQMAPPNRCMTPPPNNIATSNQENLENAVA